MSNIQHKKDRPSVHANFTINHKQTAPVRMPAEDRALIDEQVRAFKKAGGRIKKIKDGVSGHDDMSGKPKKLEEMLSDLIPCKGCSEDRNKPVSHPRRNFGQSSTDRGRVLSCRAHKNMKAREAKLKRRLSEHGTSPV